MAFHHAKDSEPVPLSHWDHFAQKWSLQGRFYRGEDYFLACHSSHFGVFRNDNNVNSQGRGETYCANDTALLLFGCRTEKLDSLRKLLRSCCRVGGTLVYSICLGTWGISKCWNRKEKPRKDIQTLEEVRSLVCKLSVHYVQKIDRLCIIFDDRPWSSVFSFAQTQLWEPDTMYSKHAVGNVRHFNR